jgi:hypothetical protein
VILLKAEAGGDATALLIASYTHKDTHTHTHTHTHTCMYIYTHTYTHTCNMYIRMGEHIFVIYIYIYIFCENFTNFSTKKLVRYKGPPWVCLSREVKFN